MTTGRTTLIVTLTVLVNRYLGNIICHDRIQRMHTPIYALLIGLVLIAAVLSVLAAKFKSRDGALAKPWPLEAKRQLLTERERALYQRLVQGILP